MLGLAIGRSLSPSTLATWYFSLSLVRQQSKVNIQVDRDMKVVSLPHSPPPVTPSNAHVPPHMQVIQERGT